MYPGLLGRKEEKKKVKEDRKAGKGRKREGRKEVWQRKDGRMEGWKGGRVEGRRMEG